MATQLLIAEDIDGTPIHLGTNLPRLTLVATLLIVKDAPEIIIVKDPPDTTTRNATHTDLAGNRNILEEHI